MFDWLGDLFKPPPWHVWAIALIACLVFWGIFFYGLFCLIARFT